MQAQPQSVVQPVPAKTPVAPASQTAPLPLDPNLFRYVGGGDVTPSSTAGPGAGW
jgi:hypothetical protein